MELLKSIVGTYYKYSYDQRECKSKIVLILDFCEIDGFYDEPIDGVLEIFTNSEKGGIEYGKVFIGCSEILRYQTDDEYDCDEVKTLIFKAMRTAFDPTKYPEVTDEDEMAELKMDFVGEPIDISVPITDIHREKLSKYGVVKDYCLYGSIYG